MGAAKMHLSLRGIFGKTLLVAAALAFSSVASAQFYVGGNLGQSKTKFDSSDFYTDPDDASEILSFDKTKTAWKLFGGYNFNQYFAVEGGYADMGKPSTKATWDGGSGKSTTKQTSWFVVGKGTLPINEQFNVFAKLGVTMNRSKFSINANDGGDTGSYSDSKTRTGALYGVGAEYNINKQVGIRLEYEDFGKFGNKFSDDDDSNFGTGRTKTSMWSVGVAYKF